MRVRTGRGETKIQRSIVETIEALGVPCERVQAGQHKVRGGYMHCASNGTPDLWTALGWIEVKKPGEDLSEDQRKWHEAAKRFGVRVAVVHSVQDAVLVVKSWLAELNHERAMGWQ